MTTREYPYTKEQIKEIRMRLDMTQAEFADYLKVGHATVPRWELGYNYPNRWTLVALRKAAAKSGL